MKIVYAYGDIHVGDSSNVTWDYVNMSDQDAYWQEKLLGSA
jgi:hypothetical protein